MKANFVCICGEADDSADPQVCSAPCRGRRLCRPLRFLRPQAHAANFLCTDTAITNKGVLFRQLKSDRQKGRPDKTVPFLRRYVMAVSEQTASFSSISFPTHGKRYGRRRHVDLSVSASPSHLPFARGGTGRCGHRPLRKCGRPMQKSRSQTRSAVLGGTGVWTDRVVRPYNERR